MYNGIVRTEVQSSQVRRYRSATHNENGNMNK